jgi:tetratricopeptide (TPR) repeat protein
MPGKKRAQEGEAKPVKHRTAESAMRPGDQACDARDFDRALVIYEQVARDFPSDPKALYKAGVILDNKGQREEAVLRMREALRRDPSYGYAAANLGMFLAEDGSLAEAAGLLRRALGGQLIDWFAANARESLDLVEETSLAMVRQLLAGAEVPAGGALLAIADALSALLGRELEDPVADPRKPALTVRAGAFTLRAAVEDGTLVVREEPSGAELLRRELPSLGQ